MFAQPIFMPRFKSINFHQNIPKFKLILQKNAKFFCAGGSASRPPCLQRRLGVLPPMRISGYVPGAFIAVMLFCVNRFCGSLVFMVFRKRLFLWASLPTPDIMFLLHHFNVFGYNSTSIVMFVCFYRYLSSAVIFFWFIFFVTAKAALPKIVLKKLSGSEAKRQTYKSTHR